MKKIGIYSGTFDPIHIGHIEFARAAIKQCQLDKVYFLIEPRPRRKQGVRAFEHRSAMVQIGLADEENLGTIILEQDRFTPHETLPLLLNRFKGGELYMLMGDDMLDHFASWPHVEELISACKFIIGRRVHDNSHITHSLQTIEKTRGLKFNYKLFESPDSSLSSNKIRQMIKRGSAPEGLPNGVDDYIKANKLYLTEDNLP